MIIKKVTEREFAELYVIIVACGQDMYQKYNLSHWYPFAPFEQFSQRLAQLDVYGIYHDDRMIGTFNLTTTPRPYYQSDHWQNPLARAVYVGNVAIDPTSQGNKIGSWCMQEIEKIAQAMAGEAIRLDCVARHPWLNSFYKKIGYQEVGAITLAEPTGTVICFEKTF